MGSAVKENSADSVQPLNSCQCKVSQDIEASHLARGGLVDIIPPFFSPSV